MDRLSQLPKELLLRILSFRPTTKDVVATMVLSRRWKFLWMLVPKLIYDDSYQNFEHERFVRFVDRSLVLHKGPETLHFKLGPTYGAVEIGIWIRIAVKCCVRALIVEIDCSSSTTPVILPRSVYMGCSMLMTLKLDHMVLLNEYELLFPVLKTLSLLSLKYPGDEFVKRFLSSCPVLENLVVKQCLNDNVTIFTAIVPSLKSLFLCETPDRVADSEHDGFVIDAPSLECLDIVVHKGGFCAIENNMSRIVKANVDVNYLHPGMILGSITSVQRLYLCLRTSKEVYPAGSVFHRLEHLKICTCETEWLNLLVSVLIDSPKLRALKLDQCHPLRSDELRPCWIEPSSVPECLLASLETFEWVKYEGTEEEKEMASFVLRTGSCLKKVTIIPHKSTDLDKKSEMLKELSLSFRRSPTCQLAFD